MLETTECIGINNDGIEYTDCMEFSLLRFLQLLLFDPQEINERARSKYPVDLEINEHYRNYINKYKFIFPDAKYYLTSTWERDDWAKTISGRPLLEYYRNDEKELFTNVKNIFSFLADVFGLDFGADPDDLEKFNTVASRFSTENKKIKFDSIDVRTQKSKHPMSSIVKMVSKQDDELFNPDIRDDVHDIVIKTTTINFTINEWPYRWLLMEMYFKNRTLFKNTFITGHSVIFHEQ
jgi:hypothetical protein